MLSAQDVHSYATPEESRVRHADLRLVLDFDRKVVAGKARLLLDRAGETLNLDTRDLTICRVDARFRLHEPDPILGARLEIHLAPGQTAVEVEWETRPDSSALQWLTPLQTAGWRQPFLFTQSQAIHARSWIPLQDSPGIRITYTAKVEAPPGIVVRMAALEGTEGTFHMPYPIPSYLIALAAGDLVFHPVSDRCGIWAEPPTIAKAVDEFEDLEEMVKAAERLYGEYRWGRFDVLVMPPSFPFGGMENPCLTFATPTILAGDKSLVSLISHELAHSWSGNLVTNATWRDFWLNEGFTTYIERRLQEELYGATRARMEAALEIAELEAEMLRLPPEDQILAIDLTGRDPDDGCTLVPYVKGASLLRLLEQEHGRARLDSFIHAYFNQFAFQSITTDEFVAFLSQNLDDRDWSRWIHEPGLPADTPRTEWSLAGEPQEGWCTQEWLAWLRTLPEPLTRDRLRELDVTWSLSECGNAEILAEWLLISIRAGCGLTPSLERFLCSVGRRKFVKPLYEALIETPSGRTKAEQIFAAARDGYHPITRATVERLLLQKEVPRKH